MSNRTRVRALPSTSPPLPAPRRRRAAPAWPQEHPLRSHVFGRGAPAKPHTNVPHMTPSAAAARNPCQPMNSREKGERELQYEKANKKNNLCVRVIAEEQRF